MHKGNNCETSFKLKEVSDKTQTLGANTPPYCENSTKNKKNYWINLSTKWANTLRLVDLVNKSDTFSFVST